MLRLLLLLRRLHVAHELLNQFCCIGECLRLLESFLWLLLWLLLLLLWLLSHGLQESSPIHALLQARRQLLLRQLLLRQLLLRE